MKGLLINLLKGIKKVLQTTFFLYIINAIVLIAVTLLDIGVHTALMAQVFVTMFWISHGQFTLNKEINKLSRKITLLKNINKVQNLKLKRKYK